MCEENITPEMKTPIIKIPNLSPVALYEKNKLVKGNGDGKLSEKLSFGECDTSSSPLLGIMAGSQPSPEIEVGGVEIVIGPSSPSKETKGHEMCDDYDSDCLVIVEAEEVRTSKDDQDVTSTSQSPPAASILGADQQLSPEEGNDCNAIRKAENSEVQGQIKLKLHNLPIHELKRKLAFCSVCHTQYQNHKQANLCLSKHGKRQCWLCLDVMANTKDSYFQHCLRHHAIGSSGQNDIVGCPYCHKFFDFRQGFNQHIVKVHFSEDITYLSSNKACLKTLVDIFTGQPQASTQQQSSPSDEVTTTSEASMSGIDNSYTRLHTPAGANGREPLLFPNPMFPRPTLSPGLNIDPLTVDSSAPAFQPSNNICMTTSTSSPISFQDNIPIKTQSNNYKIGALQIELDNKDATNNSGGGEKSPLGVTRESVIRETPHPNLIYPMVRMRHPHQFAFFHHHHQNLPRVPPPQQLPGNNNSKPGKSYSFYGTPPNPHHKNFHPIQSSYAPNASKSIRATANQQFIMSQNLNLPLPYHHHERRASFSSSSNYSQTFTSVYGNMEKFRYEGPGRQMTASGETAWTMPPQSCPQYQYPPQHHSQYRRKRSQTSSPSLAMGDPKTNVQSLHQNEQLSPQSSSPCLLEMEKLIHSTPVQVQYFNSVNSMLRTVAECNPNAAGTFSPTPFPTPTSLHSTPNPFSFLETQSVEPTQSHTANSSTLSLSPSPLSPNHTLLKGTFSTDQRSSDAENFKVPSNGGIKRRILTNFLRDEHQEVKGVGKPFFSSLVPSPTTPVVEYNNLVDQAQVEIRTGLNPINCDGSTGPQLSRRTPESREDKGFWEKVLKESKGMYGGRTSQATVEFYGTSSEGHRNLESSGEADHVSALPSQSSSSVYCHPNLDQHNHNRYDEDQCTNTTHMDDKGRQIASYQNQSYPRIMARVDASGRPVGVFTADGQPCTVSGYELNQHSLFTVAEGTHGTCASEQAASHLKYQHRIIRQITSQGSRISDEQGGGSRESQSNNNLPHHRKRKSSIPIRVLPNLSDCDNVIVQNPFEDEESSTRSKRNHLTQEHFGKVVPNCTQGQTRNQILGSMRPPPFSKPGTSSHKSQPHPNINAHIPQRSQSGFVSTVDRFINYQPKFTSGGQITDFSGRNPCFSRGGKGVKNFSNLSVATNIGVWNTGNSSVGIGVGLIKSTAGTSSDLQIQHHTNSGYYENVNGIDGIIQQGASMGNDAGSDHGGVVGWPPFAVCQRYFETTQNIMSRLKDLDKQRKGHLL